MPSKKHIYSPSAPDVIGPYSHAVQVGDLVFLSGQIALDPNSGELVNDTFRKEAKRVFDNVEALLSDMECNLNNVVKVICYLTDLSNFEQVNAVMSEKFHAPFPARVAVGVASLPRGATIEIEVMAALDD